MHWPKTEILTPAAAILFGLIAYSFFKTKNKNFRTYLLIIVFIIWLGSLTLYLLNQDNRINFQRYQWLSIGLTFAFKKDKGLLSFIPFSLNINTTVEKIILFVLMFLIIGAAINLLL